MNNIDHLDLDGYTLRAFLTVLDETSVSRAAERLGVSQSAVSHTLDKLRTIFEDPLFVRVGRGLSLFWMTSNRSLISENSTRWPRKWKQFTESNYVEVRFSDTETSLMASPSFDASTMKPPTITVPNFGSLAAMIKGTDRITTQLAVMELGLLQDLDWAPLPFRTDTVDLFLIWHRRDSDDPAGTFLSSLAWRIARPLPSRPGVR